MVWALLGIAAIVLAIKFRRFRYSLLAIVGLLALSIAIYIARQKAEEEASKHRVRTDQLVFTDLQMGPAGYGSSYRLIGRVRNNSPYSVFQVKAKFHILDCDEQSHCDVVGEEEEWDICPLVPPGQVRDIDTSIYFGTQTKVRGRYQWNYEITEIHARE
jgi:hypothetical protein